MHHCDEECKHVVQPYINQIQRQIIAEHESDNNDEENIIYNVEIPFVIKSICAAYYCKHLQYRLSFKELFTHNNYPTLEHFLSHHLADKNGEYQYCRNNWRLCPSIQRITAILRNFQSYLGSQTFGTDNVAPYITYKYYNFQQILFDYNHITEVHPENQIKFYITLTPSIHVNLSFNLSIIDKYFMSMGWI